MKTGYGDFFIFKEVKNGQIYDYAFCSHDDGEIYIDQEVPIFSQPQLHISHTTPEEAKPLFDALAKRGKKWNKEKLQIEDIPKPKTDEECLRAWGCGEKEINDYLKYREKYEKVLKELQDNSKGYIDSLNAGKIFGQLRIIADLHESSTPDRSDVLKKVIKLCEKLLNDEG